MSSGAALGRKLQHDLSRAERARKGVRNFCSDLVHHNDCDAKYLRAVHMFYIHKDINLRFLPLFVPLLSEER